MREALSLVASFHRAIRENGDRVVQVASAGDLDRIEPGERIGLVLALEGSSASESRRGPRTSSSLGVRMAGLTWNRRNAFADGAAEEEAASPGSDGSSSTASWRWV